jgi:hypothetical protein
MTNLLVSRPLAKCSTVAHDKPFRYWKNCVSFNGDWRGTRKLSEMIDNAVDITYRTFCRHCDWRQASELFGYATHPSQGLMLGADYMVSYQRSKFDGKTVYVLCHSAIEYIFIREETNGG